MKMLTKHLLSVLHKPRLPPTPLTLVEALSHEPRTALAAWLKDTPPGESRASPAPRLIPTQTLGVLLFDTVTP